MNKKHGFIVARILLGLIFVIFGLNGFFHFLPLPEPPNEQARAFMGGLFQSGYFFPFLKATEVICGVMLLANAFVPLALIVLAPIALHILAYHRLVVRGGPPLDIVIVIAMLIVAHQYKKIYQPLLKMKIKV